MLEKLTPAQVFSYKFCKFFRIVHFEEDLRTAVFFHWILTLADLFVQTFFFAGNIVQLKHSSLACHLKCYIIDVMKNKSPIFYSQPQFTFKLTLRLEEYPSQ